MTISADPGRGANGSRRRVFILEFDMAEMSSHFFNQALGFKQAAAEMGLEPCVLVPVAAGPKLTEPLDARAVIEPTPYYPSDSANDTKMPDVFGAAHRRLRRLWSTIETFGVTRNDIVVITSPRPLVIYSLGVWLGELSYDARPTTFFRFFGNEYLDFATMSYSWLKDAYRFASHSLAERPGQERIFFTVDSEALCDSLAQLCSRRVVHMPVPIYHGEGTERTKISNPGTAVVYVHLNGRSGTMLRSINDVIRLLLNKGADRRFLVKFCLLSDTALGLDPDLVARGVETVPTEQSAQDYLATIEGSDIVVLPYEPLKYRVLASGVYCEAVGRGKVVVAPEDTWMAEEIRWGRGAGVVFPKLEVRELANSIERALADLPSLLSAAGSCADEFRAVNSCHRALERMIDLASVG
jgi:hypothetical protein